MAHAVIWKYVSDDGDTKVLTGQPATFSPSEEDALTAGRLVLEKMNGDGHRLTPLCVLETDKDFEDDVYDCEELDLGPDDDYEMFFDISHMSRWTRKEWWPL